MSAWLQQLLVVLLVAGATAYAVWRLGPAALRRRFGRGGQQSGCAGCSANPEERQPPAARR